jgi:hypothetical protein
MRHVIDIECFTYHALSSQKVDLSLEQLTDLTRRLQRRTGLVFPVPAHMVESYKTCRDQIHFDQFRFNM